MSRKVLIAEDTPDIRDALKRLIELRGHFVIVAVDGHEACDLAIEHLPDLILMDLAMPRFDGLDATRIIGAHPETSNIPIIAVSSYTSGYSDEALQAGAAEVFTKTTFIQNFDSILEKYLGDGPL